MGTGPAPVMPAPVKVCPRCRAQSQTWGNKCPACGRRYSGGGSTVLKVALGVLLGFVVLIVGCAALIGAGANHVAHQLTTQQNQNAITEAQGSGVSLGTTLGDVESRFGTPKSTQESANAGLGTQQCIYYNIAGGSVGDQWQFCFDGKGSGAKLTNKNRL